MNVCSFLGNYLKQEEVEEPTIVTIRDAKEELIGEEKDRKLVLYLKEFDKGFTCNTTNINLLRSLYGSDDSDDWIGKQFTLYVDPSVMFGSKKVGGLRVRTASPE